MLNRTRARGYSLIEILLVLAIIGILSAIAIPSFMGQRRRARIIGDAMANSKVLQMGLESLKADRGTYGTVAGYDWRADGSATTGPALLPTFQPSGTSKMNYHLDITGGGLTYTLTVTDPSLGAGVTAYQTNQLGQELARLH
jgi:prepilin-type N-terminal cleavage/methylation domain-containing protein